MSEQSICEYVEVGRPTSTYGREKVPCTRHAKVKLLLGHDSELQAVYADRCLVHARSHLGTTVVAIWDSGWTPTHVTALLPAGRWGSGKLS